MFKMSTMANSADARGSLSQRCQWLSPVRQTKLTNKVQFKLGNCF